MPFAHPVTARLWEPIQPVARGESALAQPGPAVHDTWTGNEETGLYFFVLSAEEAFARAEPPLRRIPICQNTRLVLRQGHPGLPRRETRLPRH